MDRPQDNSISKQAQAFLDALPPFEDRSQLPLNGSADEWRAVQDMVEERMRPACEKARQYHNARITEIGAGMAQQSGAETFKVLQKSMQETLEDVRAAMSGQKRK